MNLNYILKKKHHNPGSKLKKLTQFPAFQSLSMAKMRRKNKTLLGRVKLTTVNTALKKEVLTPEKVSKWIVQRGIKKK